MRLLNLVEKLFRRRAESTFRLIVGSRVRIARSMRSPLPGEWGEIVEVLSDGVRGAYLVRFDSGLRFRYRLDEFDRKSLPQTTSSTPTRRLEEARN